MVFEMMSRRSSAWYLVCNQREVHESLDRASCLGLPMVDTELTLEDDRITAFYATR
jgi:hypothetical protein